MTTTTEPVTHYSPAATERALTGDIHGTLACGAAHWGFVTDDRALVTCELCKSVLDENPSRWLPPADLDPEVLSLCEAMNAFPGIFTTSSCCGHGKESFRIFFAAESLDALPGLLYWFDACHTGQYGWRVTVGTDCSADHATFMVEGPCGHYQSADAIAQHMREALA